MRLVYWGRRLDVKWDPGTKVTPSGGLAYFAVFLKVFPGPVMNCIAEWGTVGLFWLLLYWMYRREIFLRV